jgi:hypothetical protein
MYVHTVNLNLIHSTCNSSFFSDSIFYCTAEYCRVPKNIINTCCQALNEQREEHLFQKLIREKHVLLKVYLLLLIQNCVV